MSIGLKNTPQSPLVDTSRRITREWLQALIAGGSWNLIDLSTDITGTLTVGHGGTGRASLTAHDILVGNGTATVGLIAPGAAGTVLASNGASADPSFQTVTSLGGVTTTGSPAAGELTKFSGATTITNGDLSGDVTTSGTLVATLAASGVTAATYGDATHVGQFTVDAKGRITSASNVSISGGIAADYVLMSDGHTPPAAMDNGAGQFLYVGYTP